MGNRGQTSVLVGILFLVFVMLFAFTINIGMLVNAKINLQNAADLAAYAGASVQARQLNHISYLNYEMRRTYKKFLFRYYVIGTMAQSSFPQNSGSANNQARIYAPDPNSSQPADRVDFTVPSVCIQYSGGDNYCKVHSIVAARISNAGTSPFDQTMSDIIQGINMNRAGACRAVGLSNTQALLMWLLNTQQISDTTGSSTPPNIKHLVAGIGLIPRLIMNRMRIKTLDGYINEAGRQGLNRSAVGALEQDADVGRYERSIQAYFSALNTLGNHTFPDSDSVVMDEILPQQMLKLDSIKVGFDTYATFPLDTAPGVPFQDTCFSDAHLAAPPNPANDCIPCRVPIPIKAGGLEVGVSKDPSVLTYYAIRLRAKARVLFSPVGEIELTAYSAAKPFGSRIGPRFTASQPAELLWTGHRDTTFCSALGSSLGGTNNCTGALPNLALSQGETTGGNGAATKTGFNRRDMQFGYYAQIANANPANQGPGTAVDQTFNATMLDRAYEAAMAPTVTERGLYNILSFDAQSGDRVSCRPAIGSVSTTCDSFSENFYGGPLKDYQGKFAFWAPLVPKNNSNPNAVKDEVEAAMKDLFGAPPPGVAKKILTPSFINELKSNFTRYIDTIRTQTGENGEGFDIAVISDPMNHWKGQKQEPIEFYRGGTLLSTGGAGPATDPKAVKTSWFQTGDRSWQDQGRTGYSVKFVAFKYLTSPNGATADGSTLWNNTGVLPQELGNDLNQIEH